jgi:hypothetical protein
MSTQQKLPDLEQVFAASVAALGSDGGPESKRRIPLSRQFETEERRQKLALEEAAQSLARLWKLPGRDRLPLTITRQR